MYQEHTRTVYHRDIKLCLEVIIPHRVKVSVEYDYLEHIYHISGHTSSSHMKILEAMMSECM